MKKLMIIAALLASTTAFAACDREDIIPESKLPAQSRTFLKTHFDGVGIMSIVREIDDFEKDYSVYLKGGFEVNFRGSGAWDEVEGRQEALPRSFVEVLPAGISGHVTANYPDRQIVKVNRERWGYEVELSRAIGSDGTVSGRGIELDFTHSGEFFRYDD